MKALGATWQCRARPLLGTLVEVGVPDDAGPGCVDAAFAAIAGVQACLSRFEAGSELARFNALEAGWCIDAGAHLQAVLGAARQLRDATAGLFDISCGTGADGWWLHGSQLHKRAAGTTLDLGGIAKGYAVDCAVQALQAHGCASGWVNAGGDLRAFGAAQLELQLRDEAAGGVRPFAMLGDGAFATSHFTAASRSRLHGTTRAAHASVAAPACLWADALTKVVAASGDATHPALARFGAQAWLH